MNFETLFALIIRRVAFNPLLKANYFIDGKQFSTVVKSARKLADSNVYLRR